MITAVVVGTEDIKAKLDSVSEAAQKELLASISTIVIALARKIQDEKLSGQVLQSRTGSLRRSITPSVSMGAGTIQATVGTDVAYAAIHEYGGVTPPHEIVAKHGKALAFLMAGRPVFAKKVEHPGSKIPERSFLRSALEEMGPEIRAAVSDALSRAMEASR